MGEDLTTGLERDLPQYRVHARGTSALVRAIPNVEDCVTRIMVGDTSREEITMNTQIEALRAEIAQCEQEIADLTAEPGGSALHYWTISELLERIKRAEARIDWLRYEDDLRAGAKR